MILKTDPNFEEKLTFCLKKITRGIWWILTRAVESLKICTFMGYFCRGFVILELQNTDEICLIMTNSFKKDLRNLVNVHQVVKSIYFSWRNIFLDKSSPSNVNFLNFPLLAWSCPDSLCDFETRSQFLYKYCTIL